MKYKITMNSVSAHFLIPISSENLIFINSIHVFLHEIKDKINIKIWMTISFMFDILSSKIYVATSFSVAFNILSTRISTLPPLLFSCDSLPQNRFHRNDLRLLLSPNSFVHILHVSIFVHTRAHQLLPTK